MPLSSIYLQKELLAVALDHCIFSGYQYRDISIFMAENKGG
ncbi:hypothetical protein GYO_2323 [Bacillus spizizenii TU-B-10]|uniref:Uncharacterized protein n=1 Tax=Bacillus spizizenii (strain DSM 15029 / JCM 12233 / NBRC 101239 / NRRL B-23049 / TU-B-10) TaxID=1052585 RepID=G4NQ16_BACS4|nr:hypothetical protein GYO_2323 [Bacillus spizizenii TU-B-10]